MQLMNQSIQDVKRVEYAQLLNDGSEVLLKGIDELPTALAGIVRDGDLVLTMGAGSIGAAAHDIPRLLPLAMTARGVRP